MKAGCRIPKGIPNQDKSAPNAIWFDLLNSVIFFSVVPIFCSYIYTASKNVGEGLCEGFLA